MTDRAVEVACSFSGVDLATADELCADLSESLREAVPEVPAQRVRESELNQDLGTILTIVVTSQTAGLFVRELFRWASRRYDANLRLRRTDTEQTIDIKGPLTTRHEEILRSFFSGDNHA